MLLAFLKVIGLTFLAGPAFAEPEHTAAATSTEQDTTCIIETRRQPPIQAQPGKYQTVGCRYLRMYIGMSPRTAGKP